MTASHHASKTPKESEFCVKVIGCPMGARGAQRTADAALCGIKISNFIKPVRAHEVKYVRTKDDFHQFQVPDLLMSVERGMDPHLDKYVTTKDIPRVSIFFLVWCFVFSVLLYFSPMFLSVCTGQSGGCHVLVAVLRHFALYRIGSDHPLAST